MEQIFIWLTAVIIGSTINSQPVSGLETLSQAYLRRLLGRVLLYCDYLWEDLTLLRFPWGVPACPLRRVREANALSPSLRTCCLLPPVDASVVE